MIAFIRWLLERSERRAWLNECAKYDDLRGFNLEELEQAERAERRRWKSGITHLPAES